MALKKHEGPSISQPNISAGRTANRPSLNVVRMNLRTDGSPRRSNGSPVFQGRLDNP